jgi:hypothetical protein
VTAATISSWSKSRGQYDQIPQNPAAFVSDFLRRLAEPAADDEAPQDERPAGRSEKREPAAVTTAVPNDRRDTGKREWRDRLAGEDGKSEEDGRQFELADVAAIERDKCECGERECDRLRQVAEDRDDEAGIEPVRKREKW